MGSRNLDPNSLTIPVSVQTPICCPSRTETLSGRMYHNVLSDDLSGCMHVNSTGYIFQHSSSLFPALRSAGYMTGGFGKIINGQGRVFAPRDDPSKVVIDRNWEFSLRPIMKFGCWIGSACFSQTFASFENGRNSV